MLKALKQFLTLTAAEKRVFLRAWALLWVVDLGLRLVSLAKLHAWLGRGLPPEQALENPHQLAWDTWRLVDAAARHHLVKMSCLRRTLVLQRLLAAQGGKVMLADLNKAAGEALADGTYYWRVKHIDFRGSGIGSREKNLRKIV